MNDKRFACGLLALALAVAIASIAFWHLVTKDTFYEKDGHGDLARIASLDIPLPETKTIDLGGTHETLQHYLKTGSCETYDVLVVGDSASAGTGGTWWQDDLQARYGIESITALRMLQRSGYIDVQQMARLLLDLGYIDAIHPRYLVLECGERMVTRHFATELRDPPDWTRAQFEEAYLAYRETGGREIVPPTTLLSTTMGAANEAYFKNRIHEMRYDGQPAGDARRYRLQIPAFTNPGWERELLCFSQDEEYLTLPHEPAAVNENLERLAQDLRAHGTELVVLILPDKLDTYRPWLAGDAPPENTFFADMAQLPRNYTWIDTKTILRAAVASGTPDLYWCDDTHWSWRAQRLIVDALAPHLAR